jgi:RNA polymerase sigma factor (sigma-70 family)
MRSDTPTVFVVDDDPSVEKSLARLFTSVGLDVKTFSSAQDLLQNPIPQQPGCLVTDVRMPGLSGLELQRALANAGVDLPIIFITGHGDISMSVRAMKAGAVDFLTKPVSEQELLDAVQRAIERQMSLREARAEREEVRQRMALLTPREMEVIQHVLAGFINKEIARLLGVAEKTIKVHRARGMEKLEAETLADLFRLAGKAGLPASELPPARDAALAVTQRFLPYAHPPALAGVSRR